MIRNVFSPALERPSIAQPVQIDKRAILSPIKQQSLPDTFIPFSKSNTVRFAGQTQSHNDDPALSFQNEHDQALLEAAAQGDTEKVKTLVRDGQISRLDRLGDTTTVLDAILGHTVNAGHFDTAVELLKYEDTNHFTKDGLEFALPYAVNGLHLPLIEALLDKGVNPNLTWGSKVYPVWYAARNGAFGIVEALLKRGVDLDVVSEFKPTTARQELANQRNREKMITNIKKEKRQVIPLIKAAKKIHATHIKKGKVSWPFLSDKPFTQLRKASTDDIKFAAYVALLQNQPHLVRIFYNESGKYPGKSQQEILINLAGNDEQRKKFKDQLSEDTLNYIEKHSYLTDKGQIKLGEISNHRLSSLARGGNMAVESITTLIKIWRDNQKSKNVGR